MDEPVVTVAMPVRNCESTVGAAIRSMLGQTLGDWSLLLIDDGCTDATLDRIQGFSDTRIRIYSDGRSLGLPARLNQAIQLADSKYFARMDGDDIAYPERLERQIAFLESYPHVDLVGAQMLVFGTGGKVLGYWPCPEAHDQICAHPRAGFPLAHPTWCGRREWFAAHGYSVAAVRCEDQELLLRSWRHSRFANVPAILLGYREERVDLRKVLPGRYHFVKCVAREAGGWAGLETGRAAIEQAAKALVDTLAVTFGAESVLLGHRHRTLADADRARWREVWRNSSEP